MYLFFLLMTQPINHLLPHGVSESRDDCAYISSLSSALLPPAHSAEHRPPVAVEPYVTTSRGDVGSSLASFWGFLNVHKVKSASASVRLPPPCLLCAPQLNHRHFQGKCVEKQRVTATCWDNLQDERM